MKPLLKVSVRSLVEFVMQSGDINNYVLGSSRLLEGTKGHQEVQGSYDEGWESEVPVSFTYDTESMALEVGGRIDGIIKNGEKVIIEEIKTTNQPLGSISPVPVHLAQAKCYAYIYCVLNNMDSVFVQLTYYHMDSRDKREFCEEYTLLQLTLFFNSIADQYIEWMSIHENWIKVRDDSIKELCFPFENYRKGQREMAVSVYKTIREGKKLFAQAPTGTGKTIATLFPAIKGIGEGIVSKVFYLTARTVTRTIAEKALDIMREKGLGIKSVTITAKDKICFKEKAVCNPLYCEYARGYYDRIKEALADTFQQDSFTRPVIEKYAKKHSVCPFELSLDLSLWCDCIICDYNYAFDPRVYLKRFFMDRGGSYTFLIDEAHNLVDRAREMYSAALSKKEILSLKSKCSAEAPDLSKALSKVNSYMVAVRKECKKREASNFFDQKPPKDLYPLLRNVVDTCEEYLEKMEDSSLKDELLDVYFNMQNFLRTGEFYDERYVTLYEKSGDEIKVKLFCLDPSHLLRDALKRGKSSIFFSATLTPLDYFVDILGGDKDSSYRARLSSPFPKENLCLMIDSGTSTKYRMRKFSYVSIAESIKAVVSEKKGNFIVFFPSYQYMKEVYNLFIEAEGSLLKVICQRDNMSEEEREDFLKEFNSFGENTLVAFAVMGGIFGEGIDLTGERLSGAIIVGVGLPQVCTEREIIRGYFDNLNGLGFQYAYTYPGMNKVLQAAGRVIRTETDRGIVLLIDDRFPTPTYKRLYPPEWQPLNISGTNPLEQIKDYVGKFYKNEKIL